MWCRIVSMKMIIGLGNPENKYKANRHNVGHMFCEYLKNQKKLKNYKIFLSASYMNDSGSFVSSQVKKSNLNLNNLYIVHDDLDIKIGEFKIQLSKGPKDHNGLNDIYQKLGSKEFWHIRIGVDNRGEENKVEGKDYVLSDFDSNEKEILNSVFNKICKELEK